jgi:hypothetical protein
VSQRQFFTTAVVAQRRIGGLPFGTALEHRDTMVNQIAFTQRAALAALLVTILEGQQRPAVAAEPASVRRPRLDLSIGAEVVQTLSVPPDTRNDNIGSGAVIIGCSLDARVRSIVFGVNADAAATLNQGERFLGAHAGYARDSDSLELAIVPEAGAHFVTGLGEGFLTDSDSPSATLPYAGMKVGGLVRRGAGRPGFGVWLFMRADLARRTVVAHTSVFTDREDIAYTVGGASFGIAYRMQLGN